jgi:hypothetical protein
MPSIDAIEVLVKHGAKWKPEAESVSSAHRHFRHLEPSRILRVFTILKEHQAAEIRAGGQQTAPAAGLDSRAQSQGRVLYSRSHPKDAGV